MKTFSWERRRRRTAGINLDEMVDNPNFRGHNPGPLVVRLVSQRGVLDETSLARRMPGNTLEHEGVRFTVHDEPEVDAVVVFNYSRYDTTFSARPGYVWLWHNEPIVRRPFPKGFDRVFSHVTDSGDLRVVNAPPVLDWWVDKSFDELASLPVPDKTKHLSAIASTKTDIEGHRRRNAFVDWLETAHPDVDVYGHGRAHQLADKWSGLAPYRFSVTIENTSTPHYWTEKISDCFLSYTVPVYFGATNIGDYFPADSFIWLPLADIDEARETVSRLLISDDWKWRLPALEEARELVLNRYSLYSQLSSRLLAETDVIRRRPAGAVRVHGRRTRKGGWIRGQGVLGNLAAFWRKRKARRVTRVSTRM